jgi:hypothetical protein
MMASAASLSTKCLLDGFSVKAAKDTNHVRSVSVCCRINPGLSGLSCSRSLKGTPVEKAAVAIAR